MIKEVILMDKKYLGNSNTFSLFSEKELINQKYIHEISLIAEKYNILENENQLISSTDKSFLYLINYILDLEEKNEAIPKDLENIFLKNIFLKEQINTFLERNIINISKNSSIYFFKEINTIFSVLCLGTNEKILDSNFDYNFKSISIIFRFYESLLKDLINTNIELFYSTFNSYTILLKTFIQLSRINSINIMKTKYISPIFELITETISRVKFNISLNENQLKKLSAIQGKYLFYFSHLDDIDIEINNINKSIEKYFLCFEKQIIGYVLYNENISESKNIETNEFLVFKNLSSILILKLLNKLENSFFKIEDYINTEFFERISRLYYKTFFNKTHKINNKDDMKTFKKDLLNSLFYNYIFTLNSKGFVDYTYVIQDFIISEKSFDHKNLESIYNLLQFSNDIEDFNYFSIGGILLDSKAIENEYDEFYKLSIFDLLINKPLKERYSNQKIELFNKILVYLEENKVSFQLKSIYDRLYDNLSTFEMLSKEIKPKEENTINQNQKYILSSILDDDYEINY